MMSIIFNNSLIKLSWCTFLYYTTFIKLFIHCSTPCILYVSNSYTNIKSFASGELIKKSKTR